MFAKIGDHDIRTFASKEDRDRAADPAVCASDDRDLAFQTIGARIARRPIRLGFQLAFMARQGIFVDHFGRVGHGSCSC
jgi:hypothetical protein